MNFQRRERPDKEEGAGQKNSPARGNLGRGRSPLWSGFDGGAPVWPTTLISDGAHLPKEQLPPSTDVNIGAHV
jgi:hypothetical protein